MTTTARAMATSAYAMFALQQPLDLAEITRGAERQSYPLAETQTPGWFAAAASSESSLLDMAPELVAIPADADAIGVHDMGKIDLIHVYAPELAYLEELDEPAVKPVKAEEPPAAAKPRTSTQIGLLRELSNLDT
jgi:hypothetical protein